MRDAGWPYCDIQSVCSLPTFHCFVFKKRCQLVTWLAVQPISLKHSLTTSLRRAGVGCELQRLLQTSAPPPPKVNTFDTNSAAHPTHPNAHPRIITSLVPPCGNLRPTRWIVLAPMPAYPLLTPSQPRPDALLYKAPPSGAVLILGGKSLKDNEILSHIIGTKLPQTSRPPHRPWRPFR